jgi:Fe-S-cluster containining protein
MKISLTQLHADIDARVAAIRAYSPDWLCTKGCDTCCRQLADVPQLTAGEWDLLQEGLASLPPERLGEIRQMITVLTLQPNRPVVCPLLDLQTGACQVYAHRPIACRTYGFYVQRDKGLYCGDIEARVDDGSLSDVIWGNHEVIDQQLTGQGKICALTEWFERWEIKD